MSYKIPESENTSKVLSWVKEAIQEGEAFLKSQRGYSKISETIDAIMGDKTDLRSASLSSTTDNELGSLAEEVAAFLTDIKPFWEFKTLNKYYQPQATNFNNLSQHWWNCGGVSGLGNDLAFTDVVKYSEFGASGYAHLEYDDKWGDVVLNAEDPRDVLIVRPGTYRTIQDAFAIIVRNTRTVNYVRSLSIAKGKEHLIHATKDGIMQSSLAETRAGKVYEWLGSPFRNRLFSNGTVRDLPKIPSLNLYKIYIDDPALNEGITPRYMGEWITKDDGSKEPVTNWSYIAKPKEKLYPNKRMIVCTEEVVLYDGPSPYWHGMFPLVKLTLNPWPFTYLGKGLLWDLLPHQRRLDRTERIIDDNLEKIARPDIIADKNSISKAMLDRIDTRRAGGKFMTNPLAGKGFQIQEPPVLPSIVQDTVLFSIDRMESLSGVKDLNQLSKLNQMPSADTIEKAMGAMTASIRLRSRIIENFMREFAHQLAFNFMQFYTLNMRIAILGEDGVTREDLDFDPGTMIPDFVHSQDLDKTTGVPTKEALERGPRPKYDRAKAFMLSFSYNIAPGSLLAGSEIESKLLYLQLSRAGLIDHWTLLERLGIPKVGSPPPGADTITDRLIAEQEMGLGMQGSAAGRKATGQTMPRMVVKES